MSSDYQSIDVGKRREKEKEDDPHGERGRPLEEGEALATGWKKRQATGRSSMPQPLEGQSGLREKRQATGRGGRPLEGEEGNSHWSSSSSFACIFVDTNITCLNFTLHASMLHSINKRHDTALTSNPMLTSMLDISSYFG